MCIGSLGFGDSLFTPAIGQTIDRSRLQIPHSFEKVWGQVFGTSCTAGLSLIHSLSFSHSGRLANVNVKKYPVNLNCINGFYLLFAGPHVKPVTNLVEIDKNI